MDKIAGPRLHPLQAAFGQHLHRLRNHIHTQRGAWRNDRRTNLLIGYAASLSLMLIFANMPIGGPENGKNGSAFSANDIDFSEPLPIITVHEIPEKQPSAPPLERRPINTELPPVELDLTYEVTPEGSSSATETPVGLSALAPAALTSAIGLREIGGANRQLRTTVAPPPVDRAPKLRIGTMIVKYPITALKKAIEGLVIVAFTVETDGRAHAIEVVHGLHPDCDAEVVEALENARFIPGRHGGRPVPAYSQMTVRFVLADAGPTAVGP